MVSQVLVIWTRGARRPVDDRPEVRRWFIEAGMPPKITVVAPDDFVLGLIESDLDAVAAVVARQAAGLRNPPMTTGELLEGLAMVGLRNSVDALRGTTG
jgi:hypothetical protein